MNAAHKQRLLRRIAQLQQDLVPTTSNLDSMFGMIFDSFTMLNMVGEKAKPAIKIVKDLAVIVKDVVKISSGLPSGSPFDLLPDSSEERDD